ncbi:MAG: helix-turn-helix domain-containing protein [Cyclobacteriaceae bacterium]
MTDQTSQVLMVMLPSTTIEKLQETQDRILAELERVKSSTISEEYLTATEFMERVKISRATFDEKRANNEFKVIKKSRKLYVPASEVRRYMEGK